MSKMSRALIFAVILGMATAEDPYEWKGIFYTPDAKYTWMAQRVNGKYADPAMKLVAIPVSAASETELTNAGGKAATALSTQCEEVQGGGVITPKEDKCYKLVFDKARYDSLYEVNASATTAIAFFAEHLPTEFEDKDHYFKDSKGIDIEPVAQAPEGSGHSHGHGVDEFEGKCVCQATENGWKLDCSDKVKIEEAVAALKAKATCKDWDPPDDCVKNYYVMQAHHDHCLHDQLPTDIEKALHDYEQYYGDCFVKRQYDPDLGACPTVNCDDATALTKAVQTLQSGCNTTTACAESSCSAAMKTVLVAHDLCPESALPDNLEKALHDHEEPCEAQLCNTGDAVFDPYDDPCKAEVSAASGFGSQEAFLVTTLALPLAVCSSHRRHAK